MGMSQLAEARDWKFIKKAANLTQPHLLCGLECDWTNMTEAGAERTVPRATQAGHYKDLEPTSVLASHMSIWEDTGNRSERHT